MPLVMRITTCVLPPLAARLDHLDHGDGLLGLSGVVSRDSMARSFRRIGRAGSPVSKYSFA
jgi:hypothetical protein